jgi:hypothetical protein
MLTFKQFLIESQKDLLAVKGVTKNKILKHIMSHETLQHIKELHDRVFGVNNEQIILDANENKIPEDVAHFLQSKGIDLNSKTGNHLFDALSVMYNNRVVELLKFLGKNKAPQEVVTSAENYIRPIKAQKSVSSGFKILISRKKAEIAAGSTGTDWESCLAPDWEVHNGRKNFEGPAWKLIPEEIKYGTLVAYVLRASAVPNEDGEYNGKGKDGKFDKLGRVMIKMFESNTGDLMAILGDKWYGDVTPEQKKIIKDWVKKNYHFKERGNI